jgi:hypothetical protein
MIGGHQFDRKFSVPVEVTNGTVFFRLASP